MYIGSYVLDKDEKIANKNNIVVGKHSLLLFYTQSDVYKNTINYKVHFNPVHSITILLMFKKISASLSIVENYLSKIQYYDWGVS